MNQILANELYIMLDIETLSTSHNACITEIGAVVVEKPEIYFHQHCYDLSGDVSQSTLEWRRQNYLPHKPPNEVPGIANTLEDLFNWMKTLVTATGKELTIWCKGIDFDIIIIQNACKRYEITSQIPWKYNAIRDLRTLLAVFPQFKTPKELVKHNGLDDASDQAKVLNDILDYIAALETE